jgi:integrase
MALTDVAIRNAKPGEKLRKLAENGLQLWIMPSGSKLWRLSYQFASKQKLLVLGSYPTLSLADARSAREAAKAALARGIDPCEKRQADKRAASEARGNTFTAIADELLERKRREGRAEATLKKIEWLLGLARPELGKRPISEITAREVLAVLRKVEARGALDTAGSLRSLIGEVFRYAIATDRAENDPTYALRGALMAPVVRHHPAITDPKEFGALLRAIWGFDGYPTTIAALKLMAYLFPRPGELRQAQWREFDLDAAIWEIPASRMKMRRPHRIPLPRQAVAILRELHKITCRGDSGLVFVGYGRSGVRGDLRQRPISENTLNGALRRLGYTKDEATAHGFRATASTLLNENGFRPDVIEAALAHQETNAVRRAYQRSDFREERREMMQWWADYLDGLREGGKTRARAEVSPELEVA